MFGFNKYVYTFFELEHYSIIIIQTSQGDLLNIIIDEYE
jgi:hypothetical protein